MKGADHILAEGVDYAGLATDRGVDLCKQGGWYLHERDTALVAGGGKAGDVADHAASQCDECAVAVEAFFQQGIENRIQGFQVLDLLAVRQYDAREVIALQ